MQDPKSELLKPAGSPSISSLLPCSFFRRRRYIVYLSVLLVIYTECSCRFAVPIAMLGGMVKANCSDPTDMGELCWSEATKANVLGSFFYGLSSQVVTGWLAARYIGYTAGYRGWLVLSAIIQALYPLLATNSIPLLTASQALRGLASGIMHPYILYVTNTWVLVSEYKAFIAIAGSVIYLGDGTGGFLVAQVMRLGWRYFFYMSSVLYLGGFLLNMLLVTDTPETSRLLGPEEKLLYALDKKTAEAQNPGEGKQKLSVLDIVTRPYVWAFFVYMFQWNMMYFNTFSVMPFYLNQVLGLDHHTISYILVASVTLLIVSTLTMSALLPKLQKHSWIKSRMLMTLGPVLVHVTAFLALSTVENLWAGLALLGVITIASSTLFSGSVHTLNFELDPVNSPFISTITNNNLPGFIGPLVMAMMTRGDRDDTPRERWAGYFYLNAGFAVMGGAAIIAAYLARPKDWRPKIGAGDEGHRRERYISI